MRIAICENDMSVLNQYEEYLHKIKTIYPFLTFEFFFSGEEFIKRFKPEMFDIIILDIEMKKLDGIETARHIRSMDEHVIIIYASSYTKYVFESFKVEPLRFLVKPVKYEDFLEAIDVAYKKTTKNSRPFCFNNKNTQFTLQCKDIFAFEVRLRQITVYTKSEKYTFYGKLYEVHDQLRDYDFIIVHQSYLVNLNHIFRIESKLLHLTNNMTIPISEKRAKMVQQQYLQFQLRER